jgi:sulfur carrier protein ThiS
MSILVKLNASLRKEVKGYDPQTGLELAPRPGLTVGMALAEIGLRPESVKIIMVNGAAATTARELRDGDRLGLFPAVGGG